MLLLVRNLRAGRLGRILGAMRDSETGATSVGISLRKYKVFIFAAGAFVAAIGGSMLMMCDLAFNELNYSPLYSLFWFSAVVVAGLSYIAGAPMAAFLFIYFDVLFNRDGASLFVIGLLALLIAYLPGGVVGTFYRFVREGAVPRSLMARYIEARERAASRFGPEPDAPSAQPAMTTSPFAKQLLEERR
jgi:branched-chain amino acid transport system permease protein